jgi:hypothetical protein
LHDSFFVYIFIFVQLERKSHVCTRYRVSKNVISRCAASSSGYSFR